MNITDKQKQAEAAMNLSCCNEILAVTLFSKANHAAVNEVSARINSALALIESMLCGQASDRASEFIEKTRMLDAASHAKDAIDDAMED